MRLLYRDFDGKWKIANDHADSPGLDLITQRIEAILKRGEENDDRPNDDLPQRERKTQPDDD